VQQADYGEGMFYMHNFGWGWWLVMSIGMVAFWGLVIYGIVLLVRGQSPERREEPPKESPEDVLKRRLAKGEVSIDEYEQLHATIHKRPRKPIAA
jgi:putative membrane protein